MTQLRDGPAAHAGLEAHCRTQHEYGANDESITCSQRACRGGFSGLDGHTHQTQPSLTAPRCWPPRPGEAPTQGRNLPEHLWGTHGRESSVRWLISECWRVRLKFTRPHQPPPLYDLNTSLFGYDIPARSTETGAAAVEGRGGLKLPRPLSLAATPGDCGLKGKQSR
jgi:hypothetical protein